MTAEDGGAGEENPGVFAIANTANGEDYTKRLSIDKDGLVTAAGGFSGPMTSNSLTSPDDNVLAVSYTHLTLPTILLV